MTRWLVPLVAATVVVVDQATKAVVVERLGPDAQHHRVDLVGTWLAFEYAENRGVAFGLLRSFGSWVPVLAAAVLAAIIVAHARQPTHSAALSVAVGLAVGGAAGNLVDRLRSAVAHAAKAAVARADVTQDHEGGCLLRVALHPVGAPGVPADGLKSQPVDQLVRGATGAAGRHVALQPPGEGFQISDFRFRICVGHFSAAV